MDIGNMILALQDQLLQLEETVQELKREGARKEALHVEEVKQLNRRIDELMMTKSISMPETKPFPAMPDKGSGYPFMPPYTITCDAEHAVFAGNAFDKLMTLDASDPFKGHR